MGREWRTTGSVEQLVNATPEQVYAVVSDVTSTGELSDECRRAEWLPDGPQEPLTGAHFRGHNKSRLARWNRVCEVVEADPGRAFAFRTVPERLDPSRMDSTLWRYDLAPEGDRTRVRHSYEIITMPLRPFKALYGVLLPQHRDMRPSMRHTLESLAERLSARRD